MSEILQPAVPPVVYKSEVGMAITLPVILILTFVSILYLIDGIWFMAVLMAGLLAVILYFLSSITYTISDGLLHVEAGFLYNTKIRIASIRKIQETNNPISSPAASLNRLAISYNKRDIVLVSPASKMEFIVHLLQLNPEIDLQLKEQQTH